MIMVRFVCMYASKGILLISDIGLCVFVVFVVVSEFLCAYMEKGFKWAHCTVAYVRFHIIYGNGEWHDLANNDENGRKKKYI